MDENRKQTFIFTDELFERIKKISERYDYDIDEIFSLSLQLFDHLIHMKDMGWDVGAFKTEKIPDGEGFDLVGKPLCFPHEDEWEEIPESTADDEDFKNIDALYEDTKYDNEDDDDEDEKWLDIKWKP